MSLPTLLSDSEATPQAWQRRVRDVVNNMVRRTSGQGTTAQRPNSPNKGQQYYDTTIGKPCWWNGTVWKDAGGTTV